MIQLQRIQEDLSIICPGWKLLQTQVLELQYKDFKKKNVMMLANKLNFPQNLTIKVNLKSEKITEVYPTVMEKFDNSLASIPYYSMLVEYNNGPILVKKPVDYYFIEKETKFDSIFKNAGIANFFIIQRIDVTTNKLNKWYVNLKISDIKKVCNQTTTDFILKKNPNNIFIYSNEQFDDCNTLLLSYISKIYSSSVSSSPAVEVLLEELDEDEAGGTGAAATTFG
jgi:hypothetical protein